MPVTSGPEEDAKKQNGYDPLAWQLYYAIKEVLQRNGYADGFAQVGRLPGGAYVSVAGAVPFGYSGFGGAGASGSW